MTRAFARFLPPPPDLDPWQAVGWALFVAGPAIALIGSFS